ncbi:transcription factor S [Desulfurococcaceae archaeon MEX13E-LK6-19]|nr:transcription factor S [Desulfurococcaceae archaeon MEX13E-LK6-19]
MKFCPKCRSIMVPKREEGKVVFVCPRCGYKLEPTSKTELTMYKKRDVIEHTEKEKTIVISKEEEVKGLPVTRDVVCPKCGNREAYYWFLQTRAADEPPTRFFRCTKCGYVWREYD